MKVTRLRGERGKKESGQRALSCAIFCEWDGSPSPSPSTLKRCSFSKLSNESLVKFGNEMVVIGNRFLY